MWIQRLGLIATFKVSGRTGSWCVSAQKHGKLA